MMSHKLMREIAIHGFLLWFSMGFLIPFGILFIRMSNRQVSPTSKKLLSDLHITSQILAAVLATAGAVMSIKNFSNLFNNPHQKLGVVLYGVVCLQLLTGFLRPPRGSKWRGKWYVTHWLLGTSVAVLGIINTYTGLQAYTHKTSRSAKTWEVVLTIGVVCIALFYLLQDKWLYIQRPGACAVAEETVEPVAVATTVSINKKTQTMEC